jgi:hypothetical protein
MDEKAEKGKKMEPDAQETYIQRFREIEPWNYDDMVRYIWYPPQENATQRDLELWLGKWKDHYDPTRLKMKCYNVNKEGYAAVSFARIHLDVELNEQGKYVFTTSNDYEGLRFTCEHFEFRVEEVAFDEL